MHRDEFFSLQDFSHPLLFPSNVLWEPLNLLEEYLRHFIYRIEGSFPNVFFQNKAQIFIGKNVTIDPGVSIQGPCIIGDGCHLSHGAFLRGNVVLGKNCSIGHGSELKNAILYNQACVAHLCYVGDSILGQNVNLGAGVKCSNLRLDRKEVSVILDGKKVNTGRKKFGAILGDGVQVGCNAVLNPGTLVGKQSAIHPILNVGGTIPSYSQVKGLRSWSVETAPEKILERLIHEP
jgi:NDP-sugar pyrophosphorylase family protein